ncbi:MAG: DNA polymerase III subunit delta' [Gammaproteobacteria bacterium]|nr:DNA polymerase III subunit delta' [Gammaproteobacteria bacterium]
MTNKDNNSIYFWQESVWAQLTGAWEQQRMPHGLLLAGPAGLGKPRFARRLAGFVMCRDDGPAHRPCGQCKNCSMMAAGSHPDFRWVSVPEDRKTIGIDQVREVVNWMRLTSFMAGYKVVVIDDADLVTREAANSLLKTLEEPAGASLLMLISKRPHGLLATIRSRCQLVRFNRPDNKAALRWLKTQDRSADWPRLLFLAGGTPLRALAMQQDGFADTDLRFSEDLSAIIGGSKDPVAVSIEWAKEPQSVWLEWLQTVVLGLIRARAAGSVEIKECEPVHLIQGTVNINLARLYHYLDDLVAARQRSERGGLRADLMTAAMLIPWACGLNYRSIYQEE